MPCPDVALQAVEHSGVVEGATGSVELPTLRESGGYNASIKRALDTMSGPVESARCHVPGCTADLRGLPDFNIRCHTCTEHSRADFVLFGDVKYRFCQQCNKYQPLEDFEGKKRGCREKLAIHNSRRVEKRRRNALQRSLAKVMTGFGTNDKTRNTAALKKLVAKMRKACVSEAELESLVGECLPGLAAVNCTTSPTGSSAGKQSCSATAASGHIEYSRTNTGISPVSGSQQDETGAKNDLIHQELSDGGQAEPARHRLTTYSGESSMPVSFHTDLYRERVAEGTGLPQHADRQQPPAMRPPSAMSDVAPDYNCAIAPDQLLNLRCGILDQMEEDHIHLCIGPGCVGCTDQDYRKPVSASPFEGSMPRHMYHGYLPARERPAGHLSLNQLPEHHVMRISMKIDRASPHRLPADLLERVCGMVEGHQYRGHDWVTGYIRPGCVMLTMDVPLDENGPMDEQQLQQRAVQALLAPDMSWSDYAIDMLLPGGRVEYVPGRNPSVGLPMRKGPELVMVQMATADCTVQVSVRGWQDYQGQVSFLCRLEGRYADVAIVDTKAIAEDMHCITLRLNCEEDIGVAWIEIVNDDPNAFYLSEALPVLVSQNAEVCAEVCRLMHGAHLLTRSEALGVLKDVDEVLGADERGYWSLEACGRLAKVAARCGWAHTVQECIELVTLELETDEMLSAWPHLLLHSVQSGDVGTVAQVASCYVTSNTPLPLSTHDALGFTPLHWAALVGDVEVIRLLRKFDADSLWNSCPALREPHLTPAAILQDPTASIPHFMRKRAPLNKDPRPETLSAESPREPLQPQQPFLLPTHLLFFPLIFLAAVVGSRPIREWPAALALATLGGAAEYAARVGLPVWHSTMMAAFLCRHPELQGRITSTFRFEDYTLNAQYLSYWYRSVVLLDPAVLGVALFKLGVFSRTLMSEESRWVFKWALPAVVLALWRVLRRQPPEQQELYNLTFSAYSWLFFWVATSMQLPHEQSTDYSTPEQLISLYGCLSSCVAVTIISLRHAVVHPVRMYRRRQAATIGFVGAFVGLQLRLMLSTTTTYSHASFMSCASHTLASAALPALCGFLTTEVACSVLENARLRGFVSTFKKTV